MAVSRSKTGKAAAAAAPVPDLAGNGGNGSQRTGKTLGIDPVPPELDAVAHDSIRLSFLMHDVSRMRRNTYDQYMKPLGITRAQWWVLAHLSRQDGMMQTQLADVLEVGKASLGVVVEGLETSGWISRRPDPTDRRARRVYLTQPAQGLIKRMTVLEVEFNDRVFAELPLGERAALFSSLSKVKRSLARVAGSLNNTAAMAEKPPG
ncbi:MAG: MarR family transcriptional regulator [Nevskia sp.]|nr:MarR family transcriptional regulator [Nevskia sp.]